MTEHFDFDIKYLRPVGSYVKTIIRLGLPSGLTQAIFSSAMIIVQSLTNCFGEQFIAANVVTMRVDGFAMMPNFSFGQAMSVYTGQNVGAGKFDRVHAGTKQGGIIAGSFSAAITLILLFLSPILFGFFTDTQALIDLAVNMIRLCGLTPDVDIKIEEIGLRPGEKLYEELLMSEEGLSETEKENRMENYFTKEQRELIHKQLKRGIYHELYLRELITDEQLDYLLSHNV